MASTSVRPRSFACVVSVCLLSVLLILDSSNDFPISAFTGIRAILRSRRSTQQRCQPDIYQRGLEIASEKGLLPDEDSPASSKRVEMSGRTATDTAAEIVAALAGACDGCGCIVALEGEPSTEKAAVVRELRQKLNRAEIWSMNTFFRAMTFMLLTFAEQTGSTMESVLQRPEMLAAGIEMIEEMGEGQSTGALAEQAENLMSMTSDAEKITEHVPLALEYGHGEVINFVTSALKKATGKDIVVLLDGREETLRYIPASHRFQL